VEDLSFQVNKEEYFHLLKQYKDQILIGFKKMSEKQLQIKDSQVKKKLRWYILRLLRLNSRTKQRTK